MKIQSSPYKITDRTGATPNSVANASAILDIESTTKGSIPAPKMTTTQRLALGTIVVGLQVFDTTLNRLCVAISTSAGSESNWFKIAKPQLQKTIVLSSPVATDDILICEFDIPVAITKVIHKITGSTNVSFNINHSGGTDLWASDKTATTTKTTETSFTDATCTASQIRYQASAISGTPTSIEITITYTEDN